MLNVTEKSLIYIKIDNELACTGTPILELYALTTANCALKVKFKLPDLYNIKVQIDFGDPSDCQYRAGIAGVSILGESTAKAKIDEKYRHRKLDYGIIEVSSDITIFKFLLLCVNLDVEELCV